MIYFDVIRLAGSIHLTRGRIWWILYIIWGYVERKMDTTKALYRKRLIIKMYRIQVYSFVLHCIDWAVLY